MRRKTQYAGEVPGDAILMDPESLDMYEDGGPTVEEITEINEEHQRVREVLENLPELEKDVIKLLYGFVDGVEYSIKQVSELLNKSVDEVNALERSGRVLLWIGLESYMNG